MPPCQTVRAGSIPDPAVQDSVVSNISTLADGWTLSHLGGDPAPFPVEELSARVPGCVHTDLLTAGLIADPYHGTNEHLTDWIGRSDVRYRCRFSAPPPDDGERVTLRFEGIDTVAGITLNGILLGTVRDMHRSYEFDVTDLLITQAGRQNALDVVIAAPVTEARAAAERMGDRPQSGNAYPFNAIRKMACNFGWDWGPDLVTSGIFRPVRLIRWRTARLMDPVSVVASLDAVDDPPTDSAHVSTHDSAADRTGVGRTGVIRVRPAVDLDPRFAEVEGFVEGNPDVEITVSGPVRVNFGSTAPGVPLATTRVQLTGDDDITLEIPCPELWWPVGEGDQPLYQVEITLLGSNGEVLDRRCRQVGFRTVELLTQPDDFGTSFTVRVNGRELFLRGANWIPDDVFVSRVGPEDYQRGIDDALDAHMNVLRIWGGGLFADEWMLHRCDELGLMVWQDFLFACAAYSEDAELSEQVAAEATENVVRMASHPALILWNGCNENVEGYVHWGWRDSLRPDQSWGLGYYTKLLPRIVANWDGTRPYTPTSPFNPNDLMDPRNPDHGSVHSWSVWNRIDYTHYRDSVPRFCAEFGFQGPAERATLTEYLDDDPLTPSSPGMLLHEKAADGLRKLNDGFAPYLPSPADFEDWHLTTSLNQARAMECGISWFRSWWPRCAGSIIWQLNDCWPVSSWAAVDSRGRRKLLWYALRDLYDDHLLTIQPREDGPHPSGYSVIASNLAGLPWEGALTVQRCGLDGAVLSSVETPVVAGPRDNVTIALPADLVVPTDPARELLVAQLGGRRALWWFVEDVDLALEPARLIITPGDSMITVVAENLVKDLVVLGSANDHDSRDDHRDLRRGPGDAAGGPRRVTLMPGESVVLHTDFEGPDVRAQLRSVNDLLEASRRALTAAEAAERK